MGNDLQLGNNIFHLAGRSWLSMLHLHAFTLFRTLLDINQHSASQAAVHLALILLTYVLTAPQVMVNDEPDKNKLI